MTRIQKLSMCLLHNLPPPPPPIHPLSQKTTTTDTTMTLSTLPLLFLFLFLFLSTATSSSNCAGRRIHIRHLPTRFNTDLLLNCSAYHPITPSLCPYLPNSGLGPRTHNRSRSWYRTDHRLLEASFHRRLLEHPCLVSDPALADAVFLPYYASLDARRYLYGPEQNSSVEHGLELFDYLVQNEPRIWSRRGGHDHFLVMASRAWDFSQTPYGQLVWGTSFLEIPEFFNVTALTLESRSWPWQEQAIPYPTSFHPPNLARLEGWIARARRSRRTKLMVFAGSGGSLNSSPNVRRSIREECGNRTDLCEIVDCSNGKCNNDPIRFMKPMLSSKFCLHPPGDSPTRRGTFDGMLAGCVPVFFEELSAKKQYAWHLPPEEYERFSVLLPKEEVVFGDLRVTEVLAAIPDEEVERMRERVLELVPRVTYRRHGASVGLRERKDAFDLAVDGVLERIKGRIAGGEVSIGGI